MTSRHAPAGWFPRRGEVCLARMDRDRPVLVVSSDLINSRARDICVVPITSAEHPQFALRVLVAAGEGGLTRLSWAKCDQVTTLDKRFFRYPALGRLSGITLSKIELAMKTALELK